MMRVRHSGLLTTVQDLGRPGYQQYGVVVGGALDSFTARAVNLSVGNDDNAALLEMAQTGPDLVFDRDVLVAWSGADFAARVNDEPLPRDRAVRVAAGEPVSFGLARSGLRAWLAIAGGIDVPLVMGSRSTYLPGGLGGLEGRRLKTGDRLPTGSAAGPGFGLTISSRPRTSPAQRRTRACAVLSGRPIMADRTVAITSTV